MGPVCIKSGSRVHEINNPPRPPYPTKFTKATQFFAPSTLPQHLFPEEKVRWLTS
jgi:hypothetical protein